MGLWGRTKSYVSSKVSSFGKSPTAPKTQTISAPTSKSDYDINVSGTPAGETRTTSGTTVSTPGSPGGAGISGSYGGTSKGGGGGGGGGGGTLGGSSNVPTSLGGTQQTAEARLGVTQSIRTVSGGTTLKPSQKSISASSGGLPKAYVNKPFWSGVSETISNLGSRFSSPGKDKTPFGEITAPFAATQDPKFTKLTYSQFSTSMNPITYGERQDEITKIKSVGMKYEQDKAVKEMQDLFTKTSTPVVEQQTSFYQRQVDTGKMTVTQAQSGLDKSLKEYTSATLGGKEFKDIEKRFQSNVASREKALPDIPNLGSRKNPLTFPIELAALSSVVGSSIMLAVETNKAPLIIRDINKPLQTYIDYKPTTGMAIAASAVALNAGGSLFKGFRAINLADVDAATLKASGGITFAKEAPLRIGKGVIQKFTGFGDTGVSKAWITGTAETKFSKQILGSTPFKGAIKSDVLVKYTSYYSGKPMQVRATQELASTAGFVLPKTIKGEQFAVASIFKTKGKPTFLGAEMAELPGGRYKIVKAGRISKFNTASITQGEGFAAGAKIEFLHESKTIVDTKPIATGVYDELFTTKKISGLGGRKTPLSKTFTEPPSFIFTEIKPTKYSPISKPSGSGQILSTKIKSSTRASPEIVEGIGEAATKDLFRGGFTIPKSSLGSLGRSLTATRSGLFLGSTGLTTIKQTTSLTTLNNIKTRTLTSQIISPLQIQPPRIKELTAQVPKLTSKLVPTIPTFATPGIPGFSIPSIPLFPAFPIPSFGGFRGGTSIGKVKTKPISGYISSFTAWSRGIKGAVKTPTIKLGGKKYYTGFEIRPLSKKGKIVVDIK